MNADEILAGYLAGPTVTRIGWLIKIVEKGEVS